MRNNIINLGLIIIIAAIISGCASRCITVSKRADSAERFGSGFGELQALPPTTKTLTNGQLQGKIIIKNTKSSNQNFQYQVDWLDENGFSTGQTQAWNPVEIYGNLQKTITFTAPTPNAKDYNISLCRS